MTSYCSIVFLLLWITGISATELNSFQVPSTTSNACDPRESDEIKISIFSRKNKTGQLHAQVKFEEGSEKKSSWQLDIDHDSACGLPSGGLNQQLRGQPPRPFYDLVPGFGYYKYHNRGKSWYEAKHVCESEGAHLAIINSHEEVEILMELFARLPTVVAIYNHIGITDSMHEGSWVTIFGKPLNETGYTEWDVSQPKGGTAYNCACLNSKNGKMHDTYCTGNPYGFFCELEL